MGRCNPGRLAYLIIMLALVLFAANTSGVIVADTLSGIVMSHYRIGNDDPLNTMDWKGWIDQPASNILRDNNFRVRFQIDNVSSSAVTFQPRLDWSAAYGSGYSAVPAAAGTVPFFISTSDQFADAASIDTTYFALGTNSGTPQSGYAYNAENPAGTPVTINPASYMEIEFNIQAGNGAAYGSTYYFRLSDAGPPLDAYNVSGAEVSLIPPPGINDPHSSYSTTPDGCAACHRTHTAPAVNLTIMNSIELLCLTCHDGTGSYTNIAAEIGKTYAHPILQTGDTHTYDENTPAQFSGPNRHVACEDCHDLHSSWPGLHEKGNNSLPPIASASGIGVTNTGAFSVPLYNFKISASYEYELCFKCHSSWAYGATPPAAPSAVGWTFNGLLLSSVNETDQSVEFNPQNYSVHPVEQPGSNQPPISANPNWPANGKGLSNTFVSPWSASSILQCNDCHGSDTSGDPAGPHGSNQRFILKQNNTGAGSPTVFCYNCHSRDVYGDAGYTPPHAAYSRVNHTFGSDYTNGNLNRWGIWCLNCHGGDVLGGAHGTNAGLGVKGSTPTGKRMMNGAEISGWTAPTVNTGSGIIWSKTAPDAVSIPGNISKINVTSAPVTVTVSNTAISLLGDPIQSVYTATEAAARFASGLQFTVTNAASATVNGNPVAISPNPFTAVVGTDAVTVGYHTYNVVVTSSGGGQTASLSVAYYVVDDSAPVVVVTSPSSGSSVTGDSVNVAINTNSAPSTTASYQIDGGSWVTCVTPWDTTLLANGLHTIQAEDVVGGPTGYSPPINVYVSNPATTQITSPQNGATVSGTVMVSFFTDGGITSTAQISIDGGTFNPVTTNGNPGTYVWDTTVLANGPHTLQVQDTISLSTSLPVSVTVNNKPISLVGAPAQSVYTADTAAARFPTGLQFTVAYAASATVNGSPVTISDNTITAANTADAITLGVHTYNVVVTPPVGQNNSLSLIYDVMDNSAPSVVITDPLQDATVSGASYSIVVTTAGVPSTTASYQIDGGSWVLCTTPWNTAVLANGIHTIQAMDTVSGVTGYSSPITVNVSNPFTAQITSPNNGDTVSGTVTVTFATNGGATTSAQVSIDGGPWVPATANGNPGTYTWDTTGIANGNHTIQVQDWIAGITLTANYDYIP